MVQADTVNGAGGQLMMLRLHLFWLKVRDWFNLQECPKESMGYNCRHRIMSNGKKECGN
jgi:hypothetical protein